MSALEKLKGKKIESVEKTQYSEKVRIKTTEGDLILWHDQSCCEDVHLAEGYEDLKDLVGSTVRKAHKATSDKDARYGIEMWTFYITRTDKGDATLRWVGTSNGYYAVDVSEKWEDA